MPTPDQIIFTNSATSSNPLSMDQVRGLFGDVTREQSAAGLVDYADVFIRNLSTPDDPLENATVDITRPTPSPDTSIKLAVTIPTANRPAAANFIGIGSGGPPTGVTFGTATSRVSVGQSVGAVVVDGDTIYVIGRGTFRRYNRTTFAEITPRRNLDPTNTNPFGATHDDTYVYVQQSGSNRAFRYRKSDHQVSRQQLNAADNGSRGMAVDDNHFYSQPNNTTVYVYDRSWNFVGTLNLSALASATRTSIHVDDNFFYFSNYGNGTIQVLRKRVPTGGGSVSLTNSDVVTTSASIVPSRINGLDIVGNTAYFTHDAPNNALLTVPVTYTGATGLPIRLGDFTGTRRLWIERTVTAGATAFANDMPRITVRETSGE